MRRQSHAETVALPPACRVTQALFFDYLDGELLPAKVTALESHLHHCARCRRALAFSRQSEAALTSALHSVPAPGDLHAGFQARLAQKSARPRFWRTLPLALPALAAAALAFAWLHPTLRPKEALVPASPDAGTSTHIPGPSPSFASQGEGRRLLSNLPSFENKNNPWLPAVSTLSDLEKTRLSVSSKQRKRPLPSPMQEEGPGMRVEVAYAIKARPRRYRLKIIPYPSSVALAFRNKSKDMQSPGESPQAVSLLKTASALAKPTVIAMAAEATSRAFDANEATSAENEPVELQVQDDTRHFISRVQADDTAGTVITDEATGDTQESQAR